MSSVETLPTFYACIAAAIVRMSVRWKVEGGRRLMYSL
jgi:hypothetical protein